VKETWADALAYGLAVVILVVGGALVRTPILNWICGPAIVIATVSVVGGWLAKRARDQQDSP
jgi:hypothetical protein